MIERRTPVTALLPAALSVLLLLALLAWAVVLPLRSIRRRRFVPPLSQAWPVLEVPVEVRHQLAQGLECLAAMGFGRAAAVRSIERSERGWPQLQYALVLVHERVPAAAWLVQLAEPDHGRRWAIRFVSQTRGGRHLCTLNRDGRRAPLRLPDAITQRCWLPTWQAAWRAHRDAMRDIDAVGSAWLAGNATAWIERQAVLEGNSFEERRRRGGDLEDTGQGRYRLRWGGAWAQLKREWAARLHARQPMAAEPTPGRRKTLKAA